MLGNTARRADLDRVYALFPRLYERRTQPANTLSGGEQQMLALGRALMSRPRISYMDEPTMGLAPIIVDRKLSAISEMNSGESSIFLGRAERDRRFTDCTPRLRSAARSIGLDAEAASLIDNPVVNAAYLADT